MVHVLMGGKALLTVRELSVVTVTEEGGRATVELQSGKVGLAVVRERMKPGDVIEVHTPHAVAAVRGTVLVVEIVPSPAGEARHQWSLHQRASAPRQARRVAAKQSGRRAGPAGKPADRHGDPRCAGEMRPLDLATAGAVTTGLKPNQQAVTAIPEKLQAAVDQRQGVLALATAMELARGGQSSDSAKARSGKRGADGDRRSRRGWRDSGRSRSRGGSGRRSRSAGRWRLRRARWHREQPGHQQQLEHGQRVVAAAQAASAAA